MTREEAIKQAAGWYEEMVGISGTANGFIEGAKLADANPDKENVVVPRWIAEKIFTALRLNYNTMVREGFEGCLRRQTATSYNYLKLFLEKEHPTDEEIKQVTLNYLDGEISNE